MNAKFWFVAPPAPKGPDPMVEMMKQFKIQLEEANKKAEEARNAAANAAKEKDDSVSFLSGSELTYNYLTE